LWAQAVIKYVTDTKFPLIDLSTNYRYDQLKKFKLLVIELASKYNIVLKGFHRSRGIQTATAIKTNSEFDRATQMHSSYWHINVSLDSFFVFNDTKIGALERSKFHWKQRKLDSHSETIYVVEAADKNKPVLKDAFLKEIMNPPESKILQASSLLMRERAGSMGKNVTILQLESRTRGHYGNTTMVWGDAGKADAFDEATTFYYLPLSGYTSLGKVSDVKTLHQHLDKSNVFTGVIYGVRKSDMEFITTQKNWINIDTMVTEKLSKLGQADVMGLVKQAIDFKEFFQYNVYKLIKKSSPYNVLHETFKDVKVSDPKQRHSLEFLCNVYNVTTQANVDPSKLIVKYKAEVHALKQRYPLIKSLSKYGVEDTDLAEYINLIDNSKGI